MTAVRRIAAYECHTGEGVLWHPDAQRLYWVDIPNGRLFSYDPRTNSHDVVYERDGSIGGFTIEQNGDLLLFEEAGRIETWSPTDGGTTIVRESIEGEAGSRFNDVIADPLGGVFCGTMPQGESPGRLYRLDTSGALTVIEEGVRISNGLGFTRDLTGLYHTETAADTIYRYTYDPDTGAVSDRRVFVDTMDEPGRPDGLTVDSMGYVWSARWNGGCVLRYAPDGTPVGRIELPARKVSCLTFGGPSYDTAYVTTALAGGDRDAEGDGAGSVFDFDPSVRGIPEFQSAVATSAEADGTMLD